MTDLEIRQVIADALSYASVPYFDRSVTSADFVAGTSDIEMGKLEIDSLAAMELCIAIETSTGASIVPGDLSEFSSLGKLSERVSELLKAGV